MENYPATLTIAGVLEEAVDTLKEELTQGEEAVSNHRFEQSIRQLETAIEYLRKEKDYPLVTLRPDKADGLALEQIRNLLKHIEQNYHPVLNEGTNQSLCTWLGRLNEMLSSRFDGRKITRVRILTAEARSERDAAALLESAIWQFQKDNPDAGDGTVQIQITHSVQRRGAQGSRSQLNDDDVDFSFYHQHYLTATLSYETYV